MAALEPFAREDLRGVLHRFGVTIARRSLSTDSAEEVILITQEEYERIDREALTRALMDVFPHTKVWVAPDGPKWTSEAI
jgi:hypothetical protein